MKKNRQLKVISTQYIVKINNIPIKSFSDSIDAKTDLATARKFIANLTINDTIETVSLVKQTISETVINSFKTKTQTVLTSDELGLE